MNMQNNVCARHGLRITRMIDFNVHKLRIFCLFTQNTINKLQKKYYNYCSNCRKNRYFPQATELITSNEDFLAARILLDESHGYMRVVLRVLLLYG